MRVFMIVLNDMVSDSRVAKEAATLANAGYSVEIHCLGGDGLLLRQELNGAVIRRHNLWTRPLPKIAVVQWLKYLEFAIRTLVAGVRFRPNVVHAHDLNALPVGYFVSALRGSALIYDSHELWLQTNSMLRRSSLERKFWAAVEKGLAPRTQQVITVSPGLARTLKSLYQVEPVVLNNAPPNTGAIQESSNLKQELGLSNRDHLLLYHGVIAMHRGIEEALRTLVFLPPEYHLACMGPLNSHAQNLAKQAVVLGVSDRFHLVKAVPPEKVVATIVGADLGLVLIQPSSQNHLLAFPNKALECMAAGVPFLYSDFPAYHEVFGDSGFPCPPSDPQLIAQRITEILEDKDRMVRSADLGRAMFIERYSWEKQESQLLALYARM